MRTTERVTVTLPADLVDSIGRLDKKRSRFIAQAVEHELNRRRREGLLRSLERPHPDATALAEVGLHEWGAGLPAEEADLVDPSSGTPVRWIEGQGWMEQSP